MQKEDARKQSREVLHKRRKQVVRMHRKGVGVMQIVEQTGLSWTAVNTALRLHREGAGKDLKPGIRGKKPGSGRSFSPAQEQAIEQTICDKRPAFHHQYTRPTGSPASLFFRTPAWLRGLPRVLADFAAEATGPDTATFRSLLVICLSGPPGPKARKFAEAAN